MEEAKLNRLVSDEYLDLMVEHGTINDISDLVSAILAQRKELEALRRFVQLAVDSQSPDTQVMALYMGAKTARDAAAKVALLHNAYAVAEDIGNLPLPGQTEQGGFGKH